MRKILYDRRLVAASLSMALAIGSGISANVQAQDGWRRDGKTFSDQSNVATSGDFAVMQIATDDADQLMANWDQPTPGVSISTATRTIRNKPIVSFIIFKGCRANSSGNCNVTADFHTSDPFGKDYDITKSAEVWVDHPPAPGNNLQLSSSGYGLLFENKDPLGIYVVHAVITDHVSGTTLHTEQKLEVVSN